MKYFKLTVFVITIACGYGSRSSIETNDCVKEFVVLGADSSGQHVKKLIDSILVIDTILDKGKFNVFWYSDGIIKIVLNKHSIFRKFFAYDEHIKNKSHKSMAVNGKELTNVLSDRNHLFFSLTDFKGRANIFGVYFSDKDLFFYSSSPGYINPIVNESSYLFIDTEDKVILNASKTKPIDMNEHPQGWDFYIYNYTDSTFNKPKSTFISNKKLNIDDDQVLNRDNAFPFYQHAYKEIK